MRFYWIKTHPIVRRLFPNYLWEMPSADTVYLTFDDGPTPEITEWVLDRLAEAGCKATFFCIGNNVAKRPHIFARILREGHSVGNHTQHHINGWKAAQDDYLKDVDECRETLARHGASTTLFRPPYGKMTQKQSAAVRKHYRVVMWDILSADFDEKVSPARCAQNVTRHLGPGSIIIFHDSVKAWPNLREALPATLALIKEKGYRTAAL